MKPRNFLFIAIQTIRGAAMGLADAVPGVSGGTVALLLRFYDDLIDHVAAACKPLRKPLSAEAWKTSFETLPFLIPLGLALVLTVYLATKLLVGTGIDETLDAEQLFLALESHAGWLLNPNTAPWIYAGFFGAVVSTIRLPWNQSQDHKLIDYCAVAAGALIAGGVALAPAAAGSTHPLALVLAGTLALTVMLLPGISGSLTLLVLGMYQPVAAAAHQRDFVTLGWFMIGMALAAALTIPLLRKLLNHAHDRVMPWLSGLLLGSLAALWPWKSHYASKATDILGPIHPLWPGSQWSTAEWLGHLAVLVVCAVLVWLVERQAHRSHSSH